MCSATLSLLSPLVVRRMSGESSRCTTPAGCEHSEGPTGRPDAAGTGRQCARNAGIGAGGGCLGVPTLFMCSLCSFLLLCVEAASSNQRAHPLIHDLGATKHSCHAHPAASTLVLLHCIVLNCIALHCIYRLKPVWRLGLRNPSVDWRKRLLLSRACWRLHGAPRLASSTPCCSHQVAR